MQVIVKNRVPPFPAERLEAISSVLADPEAGLTESQIDPLLRNCNIPNLKSVLRKQRRKGGRPKAEQPEAGAAVSAVATPKVAARVWRPWKNRSTTASTTRGGWTARGWRT
jgi:hypothetical protein